MKRIIIVCEGPTEQEFIKSSLQIPFMNLNIYLQTPLIKASRGGIVKWNKLKEQIETHLKSDTSAYVTTLIDYYGMYSKHGFPGWVDAHNIVDKRLRISTIQQAMLDDLDPTLQNRFIPYLQLHEFEGLLFNDIDIIKSQVPPKDLVGLNELESTFRQFPDPEMINSNKATCPSERLLRIINGYNKIVYGSIIAEAIGLDRLRAKSYLFNNWITQLEVI